MFTLSSKLGDWLSFWPFGQIISDGHNLGTAQEWLVLNNLELINASMDAVRLAVRRLEGIAELGLTPRLLDGRDLASLDSLSVAYRLIESNQGKGELNAQVFEFLDLYGKLFDETYYIKGTISAYHDYDWEYYDSTITQYRVAALIDAVGLTPGSSVIDFGCGVGFYVKAFRDRGYLARGLDISHYAVSRALTINSLQVSRITAKSLSECLSTPADLLVAKDVLDHIPEKILPQLWPLIRRMGTTIILTVALSDNEGHPINSGDALDATHVVRRPRDWWIELLRSPVREDSDLCQQLKSDKAEGTLCAIIRGL